MRISHLAKNLSLGSMGKLRSKVILKPIFCFSNPYAILFCPFLNGLLLGLVYFLVCWSCFAVSSIST